MRVVSSLLAVIVVSLAAQARAGQGSAPVIHGPADAARAILATEMAFEAQSEAAGPARAMRAFMDPTDGLSFAGGEPARGADAIYRAHGGDKPAGKLTWVPAEVFASDGGDMGATWGHFSYTPPGHGPAVTGKYVTVWRKRNDRWRGVIDIGSPD